LVHFDIVSSLILYSYETEKLENVTISEESINFIAYAVAQVQDTQLQNTLDSLLTILKVSTVINKHLGADKSEGSITAALGNKLKKEKRALSGLVLYVLYFNHVTGEKGVTSELSAKARVSLIQILQALCSKYHDPSAYLAENNLKELITFFADKDTSMLVKNVAKALLSQG
jgi:hypothetical protein